MYKFTVKWVAYYQTTPRTYRRAEQMEEKEFDTKWEAERFLEEWKSKHWFADRSSVYQKVIDHRTDGEKAFDARIQERVASYRRW